MSAEVPHFLQHIPAANEPFDFDALADAIADRIVARLEARLEARLAMPVGRKGRGADSRLLTLNQAAKRLGISRCRTLPLLIKDRRLRTVTVAGLTRIPLSEVERIETEGTARFTTKGRRPVSPERAVFIGPPTSRPRRYRLRDRGLPVESS